MESIGKIKSIDWNDSRSGETPRSLRYGQFPKDRSQGVLRMSGVGQHALQTDELCEPGGALS